MNPVFEKYRPLLEVGYWIISGCIVATINGFSVVSDFQRRGLAIDTWEPFVWEFSSQIAILFLIPVILLCDRRYPIRLTKVKSSIIFHVCMSMMFSVLHVVLMVALRHITYGMVGGQYDFGQWQNELIYEYRKDIDTYISIIITFYVYRFIVSRLRSEAQEIALGEAPSDSLYVERLIVKKIDTEFILKTSDVEWIEAAGNYMNLHVKERCYPLRSTMADMEKRLDPNQFIRIHRSTIVNLDSMVEIKAVDTGDYVLTLKNGKQLKLSRRYRDNVKAILAL